MVDDNSNLPENQSNNQPNPTAPVFETVTVEPEGQTTENLQPEEVSPEVSSPEEATTSPPPEIPPEEPPIYQESKGKYLVIFGTVVFFIIVFFFLSKLIFKGGQTVTQPIKLIYWGLWEDKEVFDPLIAEYHAKNPKVTIEYQKESPQEYRERLVARSQNGQGPDIFRFHNTWLPEIKEVASPLPSSIMSNSEFEKTFYPVHQTDLKVGDNYFGLPLTVDGLVLICNDDLFKRVGITSMPTNWDEIIDDATKLSVKDNNNNLITSGIALGTTANVEHFSDIFGLFLLQNGGDLKKLDQDAATGALESYRKFAEDQKNSFWDSSMPNSLTAFIQGKVAMIFAPSWEILTIKAGNPDIKIKVVPVPVVPGGKPLSIANYWVEGVSRYSKNQIEAWKFLKFLVQKENLTKLYENEVKTRLFGEPYSRVDLASTLTQNEYLGVVIQEAKSFVSIPVISRTYDNGLNDEIIRYIENAINATIQGTSYSEALKTAKEGIDQVISKYKL